MRPVRAALRGGWVVSALLALAGCAGDRAATSAQAATAELTVSTTSAGAVTFGQVDFAGCPDPSRRMLATFALIGGRRATDATDKRSVRAGQLRAGRPVTIAASIADTRCKSAASFIPLRDQDYEVQLHMIEGVCQFSVYRQTLAGNTVVQLSPDPTAVYRSYQSLGQLCL